MRYRKSKRSSFKSRRRAPRRRVKSKRSRRMSLRSPIGSRM